MTPCSPALRACAKSWCNSEAKEQHISSSLKYNLIMGYVTRGYEATITALSVVAAAIVVFVTFGVSADVLLRAIIGRPIPWMFEVTEYALFWIPCLGMAWLARERGHVAIDIMTTRFPAAAREINDRLIAALASIATGIVFFFSWQVVAESFRRGTVLENTLQVPEALVLIVIPIGFGLTTIEFMRQAVMGQPPVRDIDPATDMY